MTPLTGSTGTTAAPATTLVPGRPGPGTPPTRAELRARPRSRLRRRPGGRRPGGGRPVGVLVALVLVVALLVAAGGLAIARLSAPAPVAAVTVNLPAARTVSAVPPALPWPATGEAAVAIPRIGFSAQSGPESPVPVASMTKVMTAYVILHDHPLSPGQPGPSITVTPADAADYATDVVTDQSSVLVDAGEVMTEAQMLEGLLVHSANDLAYSLACWDAGSVQAFVAKMNATAAAMGMSATHFADASGYTPHSVSTASDLLKVTGAAMADPVFAADVALPAVSLPVAGTVATYTPMLPGTTGGVAGVVGVKSGFTTQAGGGDILAYRSGSGPTAVTVLAAVTSQEGPGVLAAAGQIDLALARAAAAGVHPVGVVADGQAVAVARADGQAVPVVAASPAVVLAWPGERIHQVVVVSRRPRAGAPPGWGVGVARVTLGRQVVTVPLRTARRLPAPSLSERLF